MTRLVRVVPAALLMAACANSAPTLPAAASTEEAAILETVERFFAAMAAQDTAAYGAVTVPEAMTFSVRVSAEGAGPVRARTHAQHMAALAASSQPWQEQLWDPVVMVHGPIALVWTPYDFRLGGEFSHCGIDAFELMKINGAWKLTNAAWTAEPAGCSPGPVERVDGLEEERRAIMDVVQRLFTAMTARDTAAYAATLVPEATYFTQRVGGDAAGTVSMMTGAEDIASLAAATARMVERIRDPVILLHPPLAVLWAPYAFHIDDEFSHCGVNIFQLMKMGGEWKMTTATWTLETESCSDADRQRAP
jgi:ketosteroid isomerase-like protein